MTMGMMQAYRHAVQKFSGLKMPTNEVMQHWLEKVLPTLSPRMQQMFVDEVFFLSTGLPPMEADPLSESNAKKPNSQGRQPGMAKRDLKAEEDAFWLQRQAAEVFGTEEKASTWLTRRHPALKKATPLSCLGTKTGNVRVERLLTQIQQVEKRKRATDRAQGKKEHGER